MNTSSKSRFTKAKRALAGGILTQARRDLRRFRGATRSVERELYFDAHDWIMSDSCESAFSYRNVCAMLDLSPENVRREMFRDVSSTPFQYWSRRCGKALRQAHLSLRETVVSQRRRVGTEIATFAHGLS
jgi:hypothetical protein